MGKAIQELALAGNPQMPHSSKMFGRLRGLMILLAIASSSFAGPDAVELTRVEATADELLVALNDVTAVGGHPRMKAEDMTKMKELVVKTGATALCAVLRRDETTALVARLSKDAHEVGIREEGFTVTMAIADTDPPTIDLELAHKGVTTAVTVFAHQSVLVMSKDQTAIDGVRIYVFAVP